VVDLALRHRHCLLYTSFRSLRERDAGKLSRNVMERTQKYEDLSLIHI